MASRKSFSANESEAPAPRYILVECPRCKRDFCTGDGLKQPDRCVVHEPDGCRTLVRFSALTRDKDCLSIERYYFAGEMKLE
ncbi:MAG: hypothetical protein A3G34_04120 [Candidatus Lindowbacteria bacterium RIFCSPLOWO2_12_FULL_62_27]|nr:MAG: hypothetical protein A3G34_04120 [Candidatus Lindowbacteria bacterium RIFCSPLOWO2_12_FULL_62_27]OGH63634.1 MAG: hypothetical protein A3I06_14260 [Candidatus Lindowbacteria bacterium RIFCSPLOWO2_02_FULL_62_12]